MKFSDRGRRYAIDDCDFDRYRRMGGRMSRAEFFNDQFGKRQANAPRGLEQRLADHLGDQPTSGQALEARIIENVVRRKMAANSLPGEPTSSPR